MKTKGSVSALYIYVWKCDCHGRIKRVNRETSVDQCGYKFGSELSDEFDSGIGNTNNCHFKFSQFSLF